MTSYTLANSSGIRLSAIMAAHNAEKTISAAIWTALKALPKDAELLVYLDGCSDNTLAKVSKFKDKRLLFEVSEKNVGVVEARNRLIRKSRGEYLAICDADDIYLPNRFKSPLRFLSQRQADLVFQHALVVKGLLVIPQLPEPLDDRQTLLALSLGNPFVNSAGTFRKEVWEKLGGYSPVPSEDYDFWLRASQGGFRFLKLRTYGVLYRVHSHQLSQNLAWKKAVSNHKALRDLVCKQDKYARGRLGSTYVEQYLARSHRGIAKTIVKVAGGTAKLLGLNSREHQR